LRESWAPLVEVTSSWIDEPNLTNEITVDPPTMRDNWVRNISDVKRSTLLLCYNLVRPGGQGRFVEVGVALASDIPVYAVGSLLTWIHHPLVTLGASDAEMNEFLDAWRKEGASNA